MKKRGFTLIELLVTLVIMMVMILIAIPSFTKYELSASFNAKVTEVQSAVFQSSVAALNAEQSVVTSASPYYAIQVDGANKLINVYKGATLDKTISMSDSVDTVTSAKPVAKFSAGKSYGCLQPDLTTTCTEGVNNNGTFMTLKGKNGTTKSIRIDSSPVRVTIQ